jgi:biotin transport system substrate-specific component
VRRSRVSTALLVLGGALLTAAAAQVTFYIPPVPVPFTMQTFAVLLCGGVLGSRAGAASQLLYLAMGAVWFPFFAEGRSGVDALMGPTAGYLIGFVVAAFVVGKLAERGDDRRFVPAVGAFLIGSLIIYAFGVAGLMLFADLSFADAVAGGVLPFIFWDVLKALAAGVLLPGVWKLVGEKK